MSIGLLPSEKVFRVFEVCATHQSFTVAADVLGVSQSAISQQIKLLEETLGIDLFQRHGRQVSLTTSGHNLLVAQAQAFEEIREAVRKECQKLNSLEVSVQVFPGFSVRWLLPRLELFMTTHPEVSLKVLTLPGDGTPSANGADLTILYTKQNSDQWLTRDYLFPVASPKFIAKHDLADLPPEDLVQKIVSLPLLGETFSNIDDSWGEWLRGSGITLKPENLCRYPQSNMSLLLAELGQGIAMGRTVLVQDALASGSLLELGDIKIPAPANYILQENLGGPINKGARIFSNWLSSFLRST
ncbi:LysR family transcriptional regulator [Ruegeria sp. EL01]|jgi:DNA-binding transcriptional LysR family regulator|uniref:LysR family transcriptional regulator n=1 Tax=Ruegeria sp. EL01 TaxID=2107578 RepID=UPI000EA814CC|nr:LysR family transcriptional regulator [Ruegeria sp. EL01]